MTGVAPNRVVMFQPKRAVEPPGNTLFLAAILPFQPTDYMKKNALLLLFLALPLAGNTQPAADTALYAVAKRHPLPAWFQDAKLGIFIHWGLYSVPAWASPVGEPGSVPWPVWFKNNAYAEWYANTLKFRDSPTWAHHRATYGENFDYYQFIPLFNQGLQHWQPDAWANLLAESGARYVVLTTKHHDGFTLWPSQVRNPHFPTSQPTVARDLVGDLTRAVRKRGLTMGLYYSGGLDWSFNPKPIAHLNELYPSMPTDSAYGAYVDAHYRELIDRYQPDILWNDIGYPAKGDLPAMLASYYNARPNGVVNDRWAKWGVYNGEYDTPEYTVLKTTSARKWETCRGLGYSFGYNQREDVSHVLSGKALVHLLVDVVSKNGNLLLNIGPKADGTIPAIQADRLQQLGKWLAVNGEAIYGTRPYTRPEATTPDSISVRFTQKTDTLYATLLKRPTRRQVIIPGLTLPARSRVALLGVPGHQKWANQAGQVRIDLPARLPDSPAYVIRVVSRY